MNVRLLAPPARATIDDLLKVDGKAELIAGRIVHYLPTGYLPSIIAANIYRKLADYVDTSNRGVAFPDGIGFAIPLLPSGRQSFSPNTSFYDGPLPANSMRFVERPPTFAVEVRSESDYGRAAEMDMAEKREDYFLAGTLVVWDVDPVAGFIDCYRFFFYSAGTIYARTGHKRGAGVAGLAYRRRSTLRRIGIPQIAGRLPNLRCRRSPTRLE